MGRNIDVKLSIDSVSCPQDRTKMSPHSQLATGWRHQVWGCSPLEGPHQLCYNAGRRKKKFLLAVDTGVLGLLDVQRNWWISWCMKRSVKPYFRIRIHRDEQCMYASFSRKIRFYYRLNLGCSLCSLSRPRKSRRGTSDTEQVGHIVRKIRHCGRFVNILITSRFIRRVVIFLVIRCRHYITFSPVHLILCAGVRRKKSTTHVCRNTSHACAS